VNRFARLAAILSRHGQTGEKGVSKTRVKLFPTLEGTPMHDIRELIKDLTSKAFEIHQRERQLTLESVELCGRLYHFRAHLNLGMNMDDFAQRIGLTPDVYAKRAKAAGLMSRFPRIRQMVDSGELGITSVAALYPKLTQANEKALLDAVSGQPKRDVERLAARITHGGEWTPGEAEIELKLVLKESDLQKIDRAREVLSHGGKVPVTVDILMQAVEELLERRDPLRKAERAAARNSAAPQPEGELADEPLAQPCRPGAKRPAIPASVRHQVVLRDKAQCTWVHAGGKRCSERLMTELDQLVPWRLGGVHSVENLTVRCRAHNQHRAEVEMGRPLRDHG